MYIFLNKLLGPYFDFLVLTNDEYWQRSGKIQRKNAIKQEYFHHPDALRIQDSIIGLIYDCFNKSHPSFNYYGPTEYRNDNLNELLNHLSKWITRNRSCETKEEFLGLLTNYFIGEIETEIGSWDNQWKTVRDELNLIISELYNRGKIAKQKGKTLLVLGV